MAEVIPIPLDYGRRSRRLRIPWKQLLLVCVLVGAVPAVRYCVIPPVRVLSQHVAAHLQRRTVFEQCLAHTRAPGTVIFDEWSDSWPVYVHQDRPYPFTSPPPAFIRYRGDLGITFQNGFWPGLQYGRWPVHRRAPVPSTNVLRYLAGESPWGRPRESYLLGQLINLDGEADLILDSRRVRCVSGLGPPLYPEVDVFQGCYGSRYGNVYDLFLHGRNSAVGRGRLVSVTFNASTFIAGDPTPLTICVYSPGRIFRACPRHETRCGLGFQCAPSELLRLSYGEPDPKDDSHFTIRYSAGRRRGVMDGYLQSDDTVTIAARESAAN